jgi:hypothetical protein
VPCHNESSLFDSLPRPAGPNQVCSIDLFQLRSGAANTDAARARLQDQLDRLLAFSTALLAANPRVLGEVSVYRLDSLEAYGELPPPRAHWAFALQQAGMTPRQARGRGRWPSWAWAAGVCAQLGTKGVSYLPPVRGGTACRLPAPACGHPPSPQERALARLLELYRTRLAALIARREELMRLQAGCAPDWGAQEELVQELQRHQTEYTFTTMAFANALYSSILSPEQVGR